MPGALDALVGQPEVIDRGLTGRSHHARSRPPSRQRELDQRTRERILATDRPPVPHGTLRAHAAPPESPDQRLCILTLSTADASRQRALNLFTNVIQQSASSCCGLNSMNSLSSLHHAVCPGGACHRSPARAISSLPSLYSGVDGALLRNAPVRTTAQIVGQS